MKVGDLFEGMIVLEVWDFEKYCSVADEAELEYDIDDAWERWQEAGPMIVLLDSEGQELVKRWSR